MNYRDLLKSKKSAIDENNKSLLESTLFNESKLKQSARAGNQVISNIRKVGQAIVKNRDKVAAGAAAGTTAGIVGTKAYKKQKRRNKAYRQGVKDFKDFVKKEENTNINEVSKTALATGIGLGAAGGAVGGKLIGKALAGNERKKFKQRLKQKQKAAADASKSYKQKTKGFKQAAKAKRQLRKLQQPTKAELKYKKLVSDK